MTFGKVCDLCHETYPSSEPRSSDMAMLVCAKSRVAFYAEKSRHFIAPRIEKHTCARRLWVFLQDIELFLRRGAIWLRKSQHGKILRQACVREKNWKKIWWSIAKSEKISLFPVWGSTVLNGEEFIPQSF